MGIRVLTCARNAQELEDCLSSWNKQIAMVVIFKDVKKSSNRFQVHGNIIRRRNWRGSVPAFGDGAEEKDSKAKVDQRDTVVQQSLPKRNLQLPIPQNGQGRT